MIISFAGEIETPDAILGAGCQLPAFKLLAKDLDIVVMLADDPTREGLVHSHTLGGIAAIEDHGDVPTSEP